MAAPFGNQNAVKAKRWQQAIDRALSRRSKAESIEELDRLADLYLDTIEAMTIPHGKSGPSIAGLTDLADRMDGRPNQQIQAVDEEGRTLAIALVAYHDSAQLQTPALPATDAASPGLRH